MASSDVLRPPGGTPSRGADRDAALPPLPLAPTPDPDEKAPRRQVPDEAEPGEIPLDRGVGEEIVVGSATFAIPEVLIDPLLGALDETPSKAEQEAAPAPVAAAPLTTFDALGPLNLDTPMPKPKLKARAQGPRGGGAGVQEEIVYVSGPNWPMVLLGSYASAVTLALIWWVVIPRFRAPRVEPDDPRPAVKTASAGSTTRGDRSRQDAPAGVIPPDRVAALGRTIRVGSLEVTPLAVERGSVRLRRAGLAGKVEERDGGPGALKLRLRLRNVSKDLTFAPLDESFLRDREDGPSDGFVEIDGGERVYLYPLAANSEWSIDGQEFPDLRPGEAREVRVVTAAGFPAAGPAMTWRLRLRTGLDATDVVGVTVPASR